MMTRDIADRDRIVEIAKTWLNTPFVDCQGLKGHGVDCAFFLARVYAEAKIIPAYDPPFYSPQLYLHHLGDQTYLAELLKFAREISEEEVKPGDAVLYRVAKSFTHGGIVVQWPELIIHPIRQRGVIYSHGTEEGFLKRRQHRFFSIF